MTKTNLNLDRLKAVSPELAELMELIKPKASKGDKASVFFFLRCKRIAADLLRLAERNKKKDQLLLACKEFITSYREKVIERGGEGQIVEFGLRSCLECIDKEVTPASAEGGKDEQ